MKLVLVFLLSIILSPLVKKLSLFLGIVDKPNWRKAHEKVTPRLGGLSIFITFIVGFYLLDIPMVDEIKGHNYQYILLGCLVIIITGILDDKYEISAKLKLIGQFIASFIVVVFGGFYVDAVNIPLTESSVNLGFMSIPLAIIWIVAIVNAVNLIDGLDGLAAGVSVIAFSTIAFLSLMQGHMFAGLLCLVLIASTSGFLVYNFYPAKMFMGDTGSMFLGFMLSIVSIMDYKNIAVFTLTLPLVILAVPIIDTVFAILRRIINNKPLSHADKSHLHHCLMRLGFSHRDTVLIIYGFSSVFSLAAILLSTDIMWLSVLVIILLSLFIEMIVELTGVVNVKYKPIINIYNYIMKRERSM